MIPSHQPPQPAASTNIRYYVLAFLSAAAAIAYLQRSAINFLAPTMQEDLKLHMDEMGSVMAVFFWFYGLMQVPAGWLGDYWGSRRALSLYAVLWSLLTGVMGFCGSDSSLLVIWSLAGAAQAGIFPCAMIAVRDWLPATRRALASGMLASCMSLGGALAPSVTGFLIIDARWSWQFIFMVLALPGLFWAFFFFAWFRDRPEQHKRVNSSELHLIRGDDENQSPAKAAWEPLPWLALITSPAMWLICLQQFFRAAAQVFFVTWFGTYLLKGLELTERETSLLAGVPLLALIGGSLLGGVLSDWLLARTGSRRVARQGFSVVNLFVCAGLFAIAALVDNPYLIVGLISLACVAMAQGGVSAYAITLDMGGVHVATVFSFMNMSGSLGAAAFPKYVGWLVERTNNWDLVLWSITIIYLAAGLCWLLLNPNESIFGRRMNVS